MGCGEECGRRGPWPELGLQLGFQFLDLLECERADDQPPPGLTGVSQGGEHQFQHRPLANSVGDDFGAARSGFVGIAVRDSVAAGSMSSKPNLISKILQPAAERALQGQRR